MPPVSAVLFPAVVSFLFIHELDVLRQRFGSASTRSQSSMVSRSSVSGTIR